jgi:hypothetical protein
MRLIYNTFLVASLIGSTAAAAAQTTPQTPDEPRTTAPGQTQTNPGQASQSAPAQAGQTTSVQAVPATSADLKAGNSVYDQNGGLVGKIKSVDSKGAVLDTGSVAVEIPLKGFAKTDKGLAIGMTKDEVEAAAKKSPPKPK